MRADRTEPRWHTVGTADSPLTAGRAASSTATADPASAHPDQSATVTPGDSSALYRALIDADDRSDVVMLARLGWILFTIATSAQQAHRETVGLLAELRAAASAACAGEGTPASLALLRHVLAKHGWLPQRGATPLQVLAAPLCVPESAGPAVPPGGRHRAGPLPSEDLPR